MTRLTFKGTPLVLASLVALTLAFVGGVFAQGTERHGPMVTTGSLNYCADAGSTDAYACSLSPALPAYVAGARYTFKANTANTGAATLNLNSLGATALKKVQGGVTTDLQDNDILAGQVVEVVYDGTNLQMVSAPGTLLGYTLSGWAAALAPGDATTYYLGVPLGLAPRGTAAVQRVYVPRTGRITYVHVTVVNTGTAGTTETSTISLRTNDTTDTTITASLTTNNAYAEFGNAALNVAVAGGSYFELKWVTPTWATNPGAVILAWEAFVAF